jgi:hypothetical protein
MKNCLCHIENVLLKQNGILPKKRRKIQEREENYDTSLQWII